jgi:hypothetical protein
MPYMQVLASNLFRRALSDMPRLLALVRSFGPAA